MSEEDVRTIVIDNGSDTIKAGFSGDVDPKAIVSNVIGRLRRPVGGNAKDFYVGDEAYYKKGILNLSYPIDRGVITNSCDMEEIWRHTFFNELSVNPKEHPVLLAEAIYGDSWRCRSNPERIIEIMFETFDVPSFFLSKQSVLSIFPTGNATGIVLDVGDSISQIVPIYEGYSIAHASQKLEIGGSDLITWMFKLLTEIGNYLSTSEDNIVRDIKEKLCYVALDYDAEMEKPRTDINRTYELPDGNVITVGDQRFRCPEMLFKPYFNGMEYDGIDKTLFNSIKKCDIDLHKDLYSNIVLSGGSTMFDGLAERLEKEITALAPSTTDVKIIKQQEPQYAAWRGGSIFASLPFFPDIVIPQKEYEETGSRIVHSHCFQ